MNYNYILFQFIAGLLVLCNFNMIVVADEKEIISKTIKSIQVFEYGQAVTSQRELENLINKTYSSPELRSYLEAQIISALQSEKTTLAAKTFFCQKLASISSEASLPILGQMLLQDETTQMACIALKSHPSPQANHYLRKALDGLEGMSKVAVINLIGERRDTDSIEILRFLTSDDDLNTVKAAISALGNIGDSKCAKILKDLRASNKTDLKFVLADAYLQCAMSLKKENKISDAAKMLQELCQKNVPTVIRQGARNNLLDLGLLDINFDEIQAVSLFDGASFEGWNGNLKYFRIEDEAIVAGTMDEPIPRNEFLCTDREYINFELRLKCKLSAKEINGGIQIRSLRIPNSHEMWGYQADMGQNYWGSLYDESRRKVTLVDSNKVELAKVLHQTDWNDYVIRCVGRRIQLWINGYQTVNYLEPDETISQVGFIGLQIHSGPPAEAKYKEIEIRVFDMSEN